VDQYELGEKKRETEEKLPKGEYASYHSDLDKDKKSSKGDYTNLPDDFNKEKKPHDYDSLPISETTNNVSNSSSKSIARNPSNNRLSKIIPKKEEKSDYQGFPSEEDFKTNSPDKNPENEDDTTLNYVKFDALKH